MICMAPDGKLRTPDSLVTQQLARSTPVMPNPFHNHSPITEPVQARKFLRILLVDTDDGMLEVTKESLENCGHQVVTVASSARALKIFNAALSTPEAFDLLITESSIDTITGLELAERVRERVPNMPVIITSSGLEYEPPEIQEGVNRSTFCILQKPFDISGLLGVVETAVPGTNVTQSTPTQVVEFVQPVIVPPRPARNRKSLKVLVVDDTDGPREYAAEFLSTYGHRPTKARDASEALALFELALVGGEPFDLLITDYHMPGMTGLELIKMIRARDPRVPAIVMSGQLASEPYEVQLEVTRNSSGSLSKPFTLNEFVAVVDAAISGIRSHNSPVALDLGQIGHTIVMSE